MERLTRTELRNLAAHRADACISIFMPVHPGGPDVRQDFTRLKNLVARAEEQLITQGHDKPGRLLEPLRALLEDAGFFRQPGRGLALFVDAGGLRQYRTPWPLDEQVSVNGRFHIKPLLAATHDELFYVVAMSMHKVRAFAGHRGQLYELSLPDLPSDGLDDVPGKEEVNDLQQHTTRPRQMPVQDAAYHGHQDMNPGINEATARLCRATADALRSARHEHTTSPIVVVADGRLGHQLERHGQLDCIIAVVETNPDVLDENELLELAWPPVEAHLQGEERMRAERFNEAVHHELGDDDLGEIVTAANDGRVEVLFVDRRASAWGQFRPEQRDVVTHAKPCDGDDDLLDLAAALTLTHGGEVIGHVPEAIERKSAAAAIFRHRLEGGPVG